MFSHFVALYSYSFSKLPAKLSFSKWSSSSPSSLSRIELYGVIRQGRFKVSRQAFVQNHAGESFQQGLCALKNEGFHVWLSITTVQSRAVEKSCHERNPFSIYLHIQGLSFSGDDRSRLSEEWWFNSKFASVALAAYCDWNLRAQDVMMMIMYELLLYTFIRFFFNIPCSNCPLDGRAFLNRLVLSPRMRCHCVLTAEGAEGGDIRMTVLS